MGLDWLISTYSVNLFLNRGLMWNMDGCLSDGSCFGIYLWPSGGGWGRRPGCSHQGGLSAVRSEIRRWVLPVGGLQVGLKFY